MRKILSAIVLVLFLQVIISAKAVVTGIAQQGGKIVKTSPSSIYKLMETFPGCTVTVYLSGTVTLAPIFSTNQGTIKANPFTANSIDASYIFFVNEGKYDIKFSGLGITSPFTIQIGALDVISGKSVSGALTPYDFGAFGNGFSHLITAQDISDYSSTWRGTYVVGTEWDTVAIQEMVFKNFGGGSSTTACAGELNYDGTTSAGPCANTFHINGSLASKANMKIVIDGQFLINQTIICDHMNGFNWEGVNQLTTKLILTTTNQGILKANSVSYGNFTNIQFVSAVATTAALIDFYKSFLVIDDLSPQNITFERCNFAGSSVSKRGVWIARTGGGSQGDNIRFLYCYASGFYEAAYQTGGGPSLDYAYNAIYLQIDGGDIQGCPKYGVATYGGSWLIKNATFENGNFVYPTGRIQTGYDLFSEASQNINVVENVRSESIQFAFGAWHIKNCGISGPAATYVTAWQNLPNTQSFQSQLVTGTPYGGDGKMYVVTSATTFSAFLDIVSPFVEPLFFSPNWTMSFFVAGPLTPGALIGQTIVIQYPNCFRVFGTVTGNTNNAISMSSVSELFTPADVSPAQACGLHTTWALVSSIPTFGGLQDQTATAGSSTSITKGSATWTVNAFVGQKVTLMSGAGKYQYGIITANSATVITVGAGWVSDYSEVSAVGVHGTGRGEVNIQNPDATTHFVVEPNWNGGTVTSGTVSMDFVDAYAVGSSVAANNGTIDKFFAGYGTRVRIGSANGFVATIKDLLVTRQDWMGVDNAVDDTWPRFYPEKIQVQRPGATDGELLPWNIKRNNLPLASTFRDFSQKQQGREWIVWSQGSPGGGSSFQEVAIGRGDGIIWNDTNQISRNILGFAGILGKRTPIGIDQVGVDTNIQGGLSTGSGAAGAINFWIGSIGSTGTAVNSGTAVAGINPTGISWNKLGANVASTAAIVPTGNVFHVTGTTNITSIIIAGVPAGAEINMIFDGVLTVVDGSNLKLKGDFITAANDLLKLSFDGTNFYEISRSPNSTSGTFSPTMLASTSLAGVWTVGQFTSILTSSSSSATESTRVVLIPYNCTCRNFYGRWTDTGGTVLTVRKNGVDTAITIAGDSSAIPKTFSDTTHTATFVAGDLLSIGVTVASSTVGVGLGLECDKLLP